MWKRDNGEERECRRVRMERRANVEEREWRGERM